MDEIKDYLSIVEFYKIYTDIQNQNPRNNTKLSKFINKRRQISQKKKLINIINKIPLDRPLHMQDLNEYLHFINSTNLPNGDYGIITKSVDNYTDLIELDSKKSISADFKFEDQDNFNAIDISGTIIIEAQAFIELHLKVTVKENDSPQDSFISRNWNLDKLSKTFPANTDWRDKVASRCLDKLNKRLILDMCDFLIEIISSDEEEIKKYAKNHHRLYQQ